ncbi:MAG: hypothetical protein WCN86_03615, partial [bacterium]
MIKKYLPKTLAAITLAFVVFIATASSAQASAANSLSVFTGFQPYGGASQPLASAGSAGVISKPTSTPPIPLASAPYYGHMLATNSNGTPDTNSINWASSGNFFDWAAYSKKYLIWCGNMGGVPDGQMQVDVSVNGSDTYLDLPGVRKYGHWAGEWWRQGEDGATWVGPPTWFNGKTARIAAQNPGLMVVRFTFIEDAPPATTTATYLSGIVTVKSSLIPVPNTAIAGGDEIWNSPAAVAGSVITISHNSIPPNTNQNSSCGPWSGPSTDNISWSGPASDIGKGAYWHGSLWVNGCNVNSNYSTPYIDEIAIPTGW